MSGFAGGGLPGGGGMNIGDIIGKIPGLGGKGGNGGQLPGGLGGILGKIPGLGK